MTLSENIEQTIKDFDGVKRGLIAQNVSVPINTPTSSYEVLIKSIQGGGGSSDIKLFETIEQLNASLGKEGDKAVVYRKSIQNYNGIDNFDVLTFPNLVVLPSVVSGYIGAYFRSVAPDMWVDMQVMLQASEFRLDFYSESAYFTIIYSSTDGKTYTRTDTNGNPIEFGTEMKIESWEPWNDILGYFMQKSGFSFNGLFEYTTKWELAQTQFNATYADLAPSKVAFGKTGEIVGNNTVYENMPINLKFDLIMQIDRNKVLKNTVDRNMNLIPAKIYGLTTNYHPNLEKPFIIYRDGSFVEILPTNMSPYYGVTTSYQDKIYIVTYASGAVNLCILTMVDNSVVFNKKIILRTVAFDSYQFALRIKNNKMYIMYGTYQSPSPRYTNIIIFDMILETSVSYSKQSSTNIRFRYTY